MAQTRDFGQIVSFFLGVSRAREAVREGLGSRTALSLVFGVLRYVVVPRTGWAVSVLIPQGKERRSRVERLDPACEYSQCKNILTLVAKLERPPYLSQ